MNTRTRTVVASTLTLIALISVPAQADRPVIKRNGQPAVYVDTIQYRPVSSLYIVRQGKAVVQIAAGDLEYARSTRPADLDLAVKTRNVEVLDRIRREERGLGWDIVALRHLVRIHAAEQHADQTIAAFEQLRERTTELSPDIYRDYLAALHHSDRRAKLEKELEACIATGSRDLAALANIMRGDMHLKDGQTRRALVDGYLRTAVLFSDIKAQRREALEKSIAVLETLHDRRAQELKKTLHKEFTGART